MSRSKGIAQEFKETMEDNDHSLGEKAPGAPFALVALSYLAVLAIACISIAAMIWIMR